MGCCYDFGPWSLAIICSSHTWTSLHHLLQLKCFNNHSVAIQIKFLESRAQRGLVCSQRKHTGEYTRRRCGAVAYIYIRRLRWCGENSQPFHLRADGRVRVNATLRLPTEGRRCCSIRCNGGRSLHRRRASGGTAAAPQGRRGACTCDASAAEV